MKYPLEQWEHFIYITLHPQALINTINSGNYTPGIWLIPLTEEDNVKMCLLQQVALAKKKSHISACVNAAHMGCINLSQALSAYISDIRSLPEIKEQHHHVLQNYWQLQTKVYGMIAFIEQNFASYCILFKSASAGKHAYSINEIAVRFTNCKQSLQQQCNDTVLLNIALSSVENFLELNVINSSDYPRFLYFRGYIEQLEEMIASSAKTDNLVEKLKQLMLCMNYNKFSFVRYLVKTFEAQVNQCTSANEKIEQWFLYRKQLKQLQHLPHYSLFPNSPSLKKMIISHINEEIKFLKTQQVNQNTSLSQNDMLCSQERLVTCLSVAQLALFVRLMIDLDILQTKNQSALLRRITTFIRTPKTDLISEESLRSKFYTPQNASAKIIKEYLLKMMNSLRAYQ